MTLNNLADLHSDLNRKSEAEEEYRDALVIYKKLAEHNPDTYKSDVATTHNSLSHLYAYQKEFDKAISTIEEVIAIMPENAEFYDSKGEILLMNNDEQGTVEMWRKILEIDPDFVSKFKDKSELYRKLKEKGLID